MTEDKLDVVLFVRVTKGTEKALDRLVKRERERRPHDRVDRADVLRNIIGQAIEAAQ